MLGLHGSLAWPWEPQRHRLGMPLATFIEPEALDYMFVQ